MKKDQFINDIDNIKNQIEEMEFKSLTGDIKKVLRDNFNRNINFEYNSDEDFIFLMSVPDFKDFEYYYGMEYEREDINYKCELDNIVCISYNSGNERIERLIDLIESDEEED